MDHVARFAIHKETNVSTRRRFRIGVLWKHGCLHITINPLVLRFELGLLFGVQFEQIVLHLLQAGAA